MVLAVHVTRRLAVSIRTLKLITHVQVIIKLLGVFRWDPQKRQIGRGCFP
jgi:hypothetical protein